MCAITFSYCSLYSVPGKRPMPYSDSAPFWLTCKYRLCGPGYLFFAQRVQLGISASLICGTVRNDEAAL